MCIVSFVINASEFILTFNRDEFPERKSTEPKWIEYNHKALFCPLDQCAGGTWIGYNRKIIACLQNGAAKKHERHPPYLKSRGVILKELLTAEQVEGYLIAENFYRIEPFTISIYEIEKRQLSINRFDGDQLHRTFHFPENPVILCSSTLYDSEAQKTIEADFNTCQKNPQSLFEFHDEHRLGKEKNKTEVTVETVSITQMTLINKQFTCRYFDAIANKEFQFK